MFTKHELYFSTFFNSFLCALLRCIEIYMLTWLSFMVYLPYDIHVLTISNITYTLLLLLMGHIHNVYVYLAFCIILRSNTNNYIRLHKTFLHQNISLLLYGDLKNNMCSQRMFLTSQTFKKQACGSCLLVINLKIK